MKKGCLFTGLGVCFVLCLGCGGLIWWGISLNTQEARRDYDAAGQLWASGKRAEAAEKYKAIKQDYLGKDEVAVVKQRLHEFAVEQAKSEKDAADQDWAAGKKDEAAARYRSLQLDLLDPADQETVQQRIEEVDRATAQKDLEEGNTLWDAGDKTKAAAKYDGIPVDLLDPANRELVTRRLYEAANQQWDDGRKGEAAARYKRLHKGLLDAAEQETIAQRVKESDETERKYTSAKEDGHGKKVQLNNLDLYYTPAITQTEARKLGDYLEKTYGNLDHRITVQINKEGRTYQYRMVVKKGIDRDEEAMPKFKATALQLSLFVFDGADVEIHLCDDQLKTLRVVIPFNKP